MERTCFQSRWSFAVLILLQSFRIIELEWACSSAGRAPALQAGGQGFESPHVHQPNSRSLNHLRYFFCCTTFVHFRYNRYN